MKNKKTKFDKRWLSVGIGMLLLWVIDMYSFFDLTTLWNGARAGYALFGFLTAIFVILHASPDF